MKMMSNPLAKRQVLSVEQLNKQAKTLLEQQFSRIWVEGELSNLAKPSSGHIYFTLKSAKAQIRCACFRFNDRQLTFELTEGLQITVSARVSLYEGRGDYQLIVDQIEAAGDGLLQRQFEQLKAKLSKEGLFAEDRKRSLPACPRHIGLITSATGAAVRDLLSVVKRRAPFIPITIYPCQVQGSQSASEITRALALAIQDNQADVLVIGRGGGSMEDLWGFNDEALVRAIANCPIATVSAVGHEIDFTLCDFVADCRAATPSAAAELITPAIQDWIQQWNHQLRSMQQLIMQQLQHCKLTFAHLSKRLTSPTTTLEQHAQRLDHLENRLSQCIQHQMERCGQRLSSVLRALHAVSPLNTLTRGYAIGQKIDGEILTDVAQTQVGEKINLRLAKGKLICEIKSKTT